MDTLRDVQMFGKSVGRRQRTMEDMGLNKSFWLDRSNFVVTGRDRPSVGSCLVRRLVEAGAQVVCLVRDWVPQNEMVRSSPD